MSSSSSWTARAIVAIAVLSPVLAFLLAIAFEILIGVLDDACGPASLELAAAGAIGWLLLRKLWGRPRGSAAVET